MSVSTSIHLDDAPDAVGAESYAATNIMGVPYGALRLDGSDVTIFASSQILRDLAAEANRLASEVEALEEAKALSDAEPSGHLHATEV